MWAPKSKKSTSSTSTNSWPWPPQPTRSSEQTQKAPARPGGIADFNDWRERNRGLAGPELAAGCFIRIVSSPQLYVEGNQRTAMLVASYVLVRSGAPPLVLSARTKPEAARLFGEIKETRKTRLLEQPRLWKLQRRLAAFIVATADPALLA